MRRFVSRDTASAQLLVSFSAAACPETSHCIVDEREDASLDPPSQTKNNCCAQIFGTAYRARTLQMLAAINGQGTDTETEALPRGETGPLETEENAEDLEVRRSSERETTRNSSSFCDSLFGCSRRQLAREKNRERRKERTRGESRRKRRAKSYRKGELAPGSEEGTGREGGREQERDGTEIDADPEEGTTE
ncbi:hypothetical protein TGPRC2_426900 [Toxoplasma gondii TgCatPRC2]|uniref:Uncharacterized protein n=1 Tax=Toxoplasma gondii TgCatPRC2 TaxID=1130821 RepID=A0A151H201_TOXGO|nr:hypothetical protein TGPRC2_426900 [Toxoplasma gondii TgCatPRC2]